MKNIGIIIQARLNSSRLNRKILLKLNDKIIIDFLFNRLSKVENIIKIFSIPNTVENDELEEILISHKYNYYRGAEEDVLSRFYNTAKYFNLDTIIRICSDSPLIDTSIISTLVEEFKNSNADYCSNTINQTYPLGTNVEIFSFNVLEKIYNLDHNYLWREHVTPYIYKNPASFKIKQIHLPKPYKSLRLTLDEYEDYLMLKAIVKKFGEFVTISEILKDFDINPNFYTINKNIMQNKI